jgi:hypothetical protein
MHNVSFDATTTPGVLTITVAITPAAIAAAPPSSSGKTKLVASTSGSIAIASPAGSPLSFSLNVMAKG